MVFRDDPLGRPISAFSFFVCQRICSDTNITPFGCKILLINIQINFVNVKYFFAGVKLITPIELEVNS
jgi:hypothetical protein